MNKALIEKHLSLEEYKRVIKLLKREPNITELGIFSSMWSEHCSYKSSRIHLKKFPTKAPYVVQGPGENAGIIKIDDKTGLCAAFKVESHNHPSYIEPFNGAATGVGGILRDVFTMGARPIACMDSLRFGEINDDRTRYVTKGVVSGIAHYGNCVGVPTVGGDLYTDSCYKTNPLVNAFALGIVERDRIFYSKASGVGNLVIYVGAKTGRDGIHGATMASEEFSSEEELNKKVNVQVGDPFMEKLLIEACLEAMKAKGIVSIQDMGAAGLTSTSVEMASKGNVGIKLDLDKVPVRESDMTPYEIMLSESQERMLVVCQKGFENKIMGIFKKWGLDTCVIGDVIKEPNLKLYWHNKIEANIPISALTDEAPVYNRPFEKPLYILENKNYKPEFKKPGSLKEIVFKLLSSPTIASKRWVYTQYDHMVQINTITYPGSDAAVLRLKGTKKGIALSSDCNARYCYLNPYEGGRIAVAESARNVACSGAVPKAITDCLNFGNPEDKGVMWQFVRATDGMAEASKILGLPVVSGNVSFYNETALDGEKRAIYPTPVVVCVGVLDDVEKRIESFFKNEGDAIVLLGENEGNVSGSEYQKLMEGEVKGSGQHIDLLAESRLQKGLHEAASMGLIESAHDVSEGGLAVCLLEKSFKNKVGFEVSLDEDIRPDFLLFGEEPTRVVVSVKEQKLSEALSLFKKNLIPARVIGKTVSNGSARFKVNGKDILNLDISECSSVFESAFENLL